MMGLRTSLAIATLIAAGLLLAPLGDGGQVRAEGDQTAESSKAGDTAAKQAQQPITMGQFLTAAYDFCSNKQKRTAESCECEQKIIAEETRVPPDDREMAYYYWVDQATFKKKYAAKAAADPKFAKAFGERFTTLAALLMSACGV